MMYLLAIDTDVLVTVLILGVVLSVSLALLLSISSVIFHVEEDPRLQDILDMLPNQNCGLCGNPGCKAMAESILIEESKLSQCKPGTAEMREEIKEYLESNPDESGEYVKVKM